MTKAMGLSVSSVHRICPSLSGMIRPGHDHRRPRAVSSSVRLLVRSIRQGTYPVFEQARGVWRLCGAGDRARIRIRPRDRRHEAVASPCDSSHIPGPRLPVLKCLTQGSDMEPQVALLDRDIWPDSRHQLLLADNFAGVFDKNDKNVERPSTQMNWAARPRKISACWKQAKRTERNRVRSRSGLFVSHLHSLNILRRNVELLRVTKSFDIFEEYLFRIFDIKHPAIRV